MWIIYCCLLFIASVSAMTDAEAKAEFIKITMVCSKDYPVEMSDILKLNSYVLPKSEGPKCLLACTYRKIGTMNEDGMFDLDKGYQVAERTKMGDEEAIKNGKKLAEICIKKANDHKVSDGKKGCERAGVMFVCVVETAPKLGFTI